MASARPQGLALQAGTSMAAPALRPSAQRPRPSASASRPAQATVLRIRRAATAPKASPPGRSRPRGGALVCNAATATAEAVTQLIAFDGARQAASHAPARGTTNCPTMFTHLPLGAEESRALALQRAGAAR